MATTYEYYACAVDQDGKMVFNDATKAWVALKTQLDLWGADGWEVVATLDTTHPRQIIFMKTTTV